MYPPGQTLSVRDGGLGLLSTQTALPLIIGVSSIGSTDTLYQFTDPNTLKDTLGHGPAPELALPVISAAGGCLVLKTSASTAGVAGAVTPTRVGTSTGTITVAGAPYLAFEVIVRIKKTGTVATGKFDYSLDDGYTFSEEITIPSGGTYTVTGTNLVLTFVPGAGAVFFEIGDKHEFDCTAPHYTTTNLGTAITALLAQIGTAKLRRIAFTGKNSSAANGATMAAAVATHLATLASSSYYCRGMLDVGNDTAANVITSMLAFSNARVAVAFGDADQITLDNFMGYGVPKLPAMNAAFERAAGADMSENLGRKESGSLRGVRAISSDEGLSASFSEADKIITLRSYRGESGFYVTNGYLKSPAGSDFQYWDWGCTMDEGCETVVTSQARWILKKLRSLTDGTGKIDSRDSSRLEQFVRRALAAKLLDPTNVEGFKGHVSAVQYTVDQTNDFLSTRTIRSAMGAVPLVPVEGITTQAGFVRSVA